MNTATHGTTAVDWETRVDYDRLRRERVQKLRAELDKSEMGALLAFDFSNIRFMTSTHIGTWAMDKLIRFSLITRHSDPISWDFGSAAKHHQQRNPWLQTTSMEADADPHAPHHGAERPRKVDGARAGISTLRGAFHPDSGVAQKVAQKIKDELGEYGLLDAPLGVDVIELPILLALQAKGITVIDGQQAFMEARRVKTQDEITLLTQAASMVDAAYEDLYQFLRPGVKENECVGLVSKKLYDLGSEYVEGVNAISGERCSPHPHVFSDRLIRPGDPAFFDILHSYQGYRTCYYRTFAVGPRARPSATPTPLPGVHGPGDRPGEARRHDRRHREASGRRRQEFGFPDEEAAFALQYGHGVGPVDLGEADLLAASSPWTTPKSSRRAMFSRWRPTGRRPTGSAQPASRRSSWSPPTGAR